MLRIYFIISTAIASLFTTVLHAENLFDAHDLAATNESIVATDGKHKGERLIGYKTFSSSRIVFYVLERYQPVLNCILHDAQRDDGKIRMNDRNVIFHTSRKKINQNFSIIPSENAATFHPDDVRLREKKKLFNEPDLYLVIANEDGKIKIDYFQYQKILEAKIVAGSREKLIMINFARLRHNPLNQPYITVVDAPTVSH